MIRHFYHVWAEGAWTGPVNEHIAALNDAGFTWDITVGVVGPADARDAARQRIVERLTVGGSLDWLEADAGHEQVTLRALRDWARDHSDVILYAHTKGAHNPSPLNAAWRRSMTQLLIDGWRDCLSLLGDGYDAVGCHWLTSADYPSQVMSPFFGGNFWWATTDYLRKLPPVGDLSRYDAESWIGLGNPRVFDLLPGWPAPELFQ